MDNPKREIEQLKREVDDLTRQVRQLTQRLDKLDGGYEDRPNSSQDVFGS